MLPILPFPAAQPHTAVWTSVKAGTGIAEYIFVIIMKLAERIDVQMICCSLNGSWTMGRADQTSRYPATVPGSVYMDLLNAGAMEDPFWRDNETSALELMDHDYLYTRTFTVSENLLHCSAVLLRCEGLDTLCELTLNGIRIGQANNMHRIWEFDISSSLLSGENQLEIRFFSPTKYIADSYQTSKADGTADAMVGFPNLRKAHCMFGWDWGPRLPDMGIWRDISIIGIEHARIDNVYLTQQHENGRVTLHISTALQLLENLPDVKVSVELTAPNGKIQYAEGPECDILVENPLLWWPNGLGDQPLYKVRVELRSHERTLDSWSRRIGLRTLTIHREKDEWGERFCHCVNGIEFFAMGADYIPEDNLLPRVTPQRTRRLLEDSAMAHFNVIRVWGGGYYPDDFFYDACDELGLVVWQDFMFACAVYNLSDEFDTNIRAEIRDNVRRLRHHPSLGLWCGNNEMEMFVSYGTWLANDRQRADYIKMYEYIFPQILKQEDPQTFYWPASPSSGGSFDKPNDPDRGDVHYWDVWHANKPFTDYRNHLFRYVSEFGFQSFPCLRTVESFTLPEDRNVFSYVMEKHQRNASANGKILSYLSQTYLYPASFDLLLYASQLLQAQAIQYGVEHWRRNRGRCMGAIVWQLNDCWPVASWSSIDYFGRWKALHYAMKRFFAPILLSCQEEGMLSPGAHINAQPAPLKKSARFNVSNESPASFSGTVHWALRDPNAQILQSGEAAVTVPARSAHWLKELDFSTADTYSNYLSYQLEQDGTLLGEGSVLFCPPKHFRFADPKLTALIEGNSILVSASAFAKSVELLCDDDVLLEDNYFDLHAGTKQIRILRGNPKTVTVRSVYDIR